MFYTYSHATPQGRLFYIGKGKKDRAYQICKRNTLWQRIVAKHGRPDVQILSYWKTNEEACSHEILLIDCFKKLGHQLCNMTNGGDGSLGVIPWNKGKPWSKEIKAKMGLTNKGNKYWVGRKHSDETKQKQRIAQTKYKFIGTNITTNETITVIGKEALFNAGFTPTHVYRCAKGLSDAHKGYIWTKELLKDKV